MTRRDEKRAPDTIIERYQVDWENDDDVLDYIESRWLNKDQFKGGLEKKWLEVIAAYEGFPYLSFDELTAKLVEDRKIPRWRVNLVVNLLLPAVRTGATKHLRNRPIWDVLPATSDVEDIVRASKSKKSLRGYWYNNDVDYKFIDILLWLGLTGNAFAKISWDPDKGPEMELSPREFLPKDLLTNNPDPERLQLALLEAQESFNKFVEVNNGNILPLGEVDLHIPTPFDMLFPYGDNFYEVPWLIESQIRDVSHYFDLGYDPKKFEPPTKKEMRYLYYAKRIHNLYRLGYHTTSPIYRENEVLELHLWLPKSRQFRKGFHAVAAGGMIIYKGENPYKHRQPPYVHFGSEKVPGKIWHFSSIEMALPVIKQYQATKSQMTENKNLLGKPKWLVSRASRVSSTAITSEPGEIIKYTGVKAPEMIPPPGMPRYIEDLLILDRRDIDDIVARHDASMGKNPSGSRSGLMNINLQEQDDGQLAIVGLNLDVGMSKIGRLILATQDQFYKEDRIVNFLGEKSRFEAFSLKRGDLSNPEALTGSDYFNVRVTQFSQFGLSRAGQLEFLKVLLQYQIFTPEDREKVMKFIQMGWFEDELDEFQIDRSNAHRENLLMTQGQPNPVDISDEDKVHIEEHKIYQKTDEYKTLDPQIKSLHQQHNQQHKLFMVMKLIEPQVLMIPAQFLAMALNNVPLELMGAMNNGQGNRTGGQGTTGSQGKTGSQGTTGSRTGNKSTSRV